MEPVLYACERAEPLDERNIIIQSENDYRFGSDSVSLYKFAERFLKGGERVFDLCSGCGIIGILLAIAGYSVTGAEIDEAQWDRSVRSCAANGLYNVRFMRADIRSLRLDGAPYDAVVCNPPFFKANSRASRIAPQANAEMSVTFSDVVGAAARLLRMGGQFFLVHTATRLDEVLCSCLRAGLTPKNLTLGRNCKTFMLRAVRGGKLGLKTEIGD